MKSLISALACSVLATSAMGDVVREGAGQRRAKLDAMELKSFDTGMLSELNGWSNETGVSQGDLSGKVVLLVTWASWYSPSQQVLPLAQQLADRHDDLVVIGVHHPKGFDKAQAIAKGRGVRFPIAHDVDGRVREALMVDQDPDFYVIDRAGQMRYADIATGSVTGAVSELINESRELASTLNERLAEQQRLADAQFRRTGKINQEVDLRSMPEISFQPPSPGEWAAVEDDWPEMETNNRRRRGDPDERRLVISAEMPTLPKAVPTKGRALVVYFWHPDLLWTHERSMIEAERLQKLKGRDVAVYGVLTPRQERRNRRDDEDESNSAERLSKVLADTARKKNLTHAISLDINGSMINAATGNRSGNQFDFEDGDLGKDGWLGAPVAVVSSDGVVRWVGLMSNPRFKASLETVLRIDPGIQARRDAEADYIRVQGR